MPRASDPIDDTTPLTGPRIDVAARIGWLLRTSRVAGGLSLRQMSAALREHGPTVSAATLSRVESEGQRSPAVLDGYNRVLGLPGGLLGSAVDMLCRTFPYSPAAPVEHPQDSLDSFSAAYDAVTGDRPTALDWLEFARHHAGGSGFGLPRSLMEPLVERLLHETGRGVAAARFVRSEAIVQLLRSPYRDLTEQAARTAVEDLDHQNFYDLTAVLCDSANVELAHWAGGLLSSPSIFHVRGASYVLLGMLVSSRLSRSEWATLVPHLERAWVAAGDDPERRAIVAEVAGALPPGLSVERHDEGGLAPTPPQPTVEWTRTRTNVHYAFATRIAHGACARIGLPDDPLLARLLFEAFFEPRGVRMSQAAWLTAHSAYAAHVSAEILAQVDRCPDPETRAEALRVAALCHRGETPDRVAELVTTGVVSDFMHACTIVGRSGGCLPDAALAWGLAGDPTVVRQTLYCLGMAGDPRLERLAEDPSLPASTRAAAAWWIRQGSRILA